MHTPSWLQRAIDSHKDRVRDQWLGSSITRPSPGARTANGIFLQSNDYLGLGGDARIIDAEMDALSNSGHSLMMSAVFEDPESSAGAALEQAFAEHLQTEGSIFCQSGFAANAGLLEALASQGQPMYVDFAAHRSLSFGIDAARKKWIPFAHNSLTSLDRKLKTYGAGVIVIDSVYSSSGEIAPLREIANMALVHDCVLVVDESHAIGTHGSCGEGLVAAMGLQNVVHYRTASLAKAFAGIGGIIAGPSSYLDFLRYHGSPQVFSSAPLPHTAAAFTKTLQIVRDAGQRRKRLAERSDLFRHAMRSAGMDIGESASQIVSIYPGPEKVTAAVKAFLERRGIFGSVFAAPATPRRKALIRFSVCHTHSEEDLIKVADTCRLLHKEFDTSTWRSHGSATSAGTPAGTL